MTADAPALLEQAVESAELTALDALGHVAVGTVLVDRIGLAWQVVELGANWSATKGGKDTRRAGFAMAGSHVTYELDQMASVLPIRIVDDGHAAWPAGEGTGAALPRSAPDGLILLSGEMPPPAPAPARREVPNP